MADTDRNQQLNIPFKEPTFIIKSGFQIGKMRLELVKEALSYHVAIEKVSSCWQSTDF